MQSKIVKAVQAHGWGPGGQAKPHKARVYQRQGMISATMPAGQSTLADLRKAGIITSQEVVAAIGLYLRDPVSGPYRFASGHSIDIAALLRATPAFGAVDRSGPQEKAFRTVLAAAVMSAQPTTP